MQRLFVMFPDRAPGIGLVLLRLSLCAPLLMQWAAPWSLRDGGLLLAMVLLAVGWLTPFASVLALLLVVAGPAPQWPWAGVAAALLLLGPGAYSLDGCRFGRRVLLRGPTVRRTTAPPKE